MDGEEERGAAGPEARLKGEILASLSAWSADYRLLRLDLAWVVTQQLLRHVARNQALEVYLEFLEKLAAHAGQEAHEIRGVIAEDARKRAH